jgi:hypothetical protein
MAIHQAAEHKKQRRTVNKVLADVAGYTNKLKEMLVNHTYKPTEPRVMVRYDNNDKKERRIQVVPFFPDGVVHRLVVNTIRPVIEPGMYEFSCGSMPDKGTHFAKEYLEEAVHNDPKNTRYAFYFDIKKFFDTVKRDFMMATLRMKIKDKELLRLIEKIFPEQGLPIGFYLSQWLGNYVLTAMDNLILRHHTVRRDKKNQTAKYYARYVDDCIVLGNNKKQLHDLQKVVAEWLNANGLAMKKTWQIFPVNKRPLNFVGFLIYRGTTKIRKRNLYKLTRSAKQYKTKPESFVSRYSFVMHTQSFNLERQLGKTFTKAKKIISKNAKAQAKALKSR